MSETTSLSPAFVPPKPQVSIGMPVYNGAAYIREALDSLLAQTFKDFELIISDNASTDDTQAICEEYARRDPRIRYVRQGENKGVLANFQFVLDQAKGDYFMWAAADDRWNEYWVESIYTRINGGKCTAGFGELSHIDASGARLPHPANGARFQFNSNRLWRKLTFYLAYEGMGKANLFYALYPREVLRRVDLQSHQFDYQFLFSLLDQLTYVHVEEARLYKRIHDACAGLGPKHVKRPPFGFAAVRILWHNMRIVTHYLKVAKPKLRVVLLLLIPLKLLISMRFYVMQSVRRKIGVRWS